MHPTVYVYMFLMEQRVHSLSPVNQHKGRVNLNPSLQTKSLLCDLTALISVLRQPAHQNLALHSVRVVYVGDVDCDKIIMLT